jgi:hypothetical protein
MPKTAEERFRIECRGKDSWEVQIATVNGSGKRHAERYRKIAEEEGFEATLTNDPLASRQFRLTIIKRRV